MKNHLKDFYLYLIRTGRKKSTTNYYVRYIDYILNQVSPLNKPHFDKFITNLIQKGYSGKYLNFLISIVRVYARFKNIKGFEDYPLFKAKEAVKAILSAEEIERFLALKPTPKNKPERFKFWTMFFSIMAYTGMRPGEVAKLRANDIDFGREVFIVGDTKTNDFRFVPISPNLILPLKKHLKEYSPLLFPGYNKERPLYQSAWSTNFKKRIKRLGIKRTNLTPNSLRHSFITRLLEEDVNIFKVQKMVGHKRIETTAHYTHLTTKDIIKAIKKDPLIRKDVDPKDVLKRLKETIEAFKLDEDKRFDYELTETANSLKISIFLR